MFSENIRKIFRFDRIVKLSCENQTNLMEEKINYYNDDDLILFYDVKIYFTYQ